MPRTIENLLADGAREVPVGRSRSVGKTITWIVKDGKSAGTICTYTILPKERVQKARKQAWEWKKRQRELQGETSDGFACCFMYAGKL